MVEDFGVPVPGETIGGTWVSLGYLAGHRIDAIYRYITRYSYYLPIALVATPVLSAFAEPRWPLTRRACHRGASGGSACA
jgi:hypothetical protein